MRERSRHWHLEGLRGVACLAVVLLHGFGMFFPALVERQAVPSLLDAVRVSPLRLLWDGDAAVFLFFTLSGFVLTGPFLRTPVGPFTLMAARILRFLPAVAVGCLVGWVLCRSVPDAHLRAAALIGGGWMAGGWDAVPTVPALLRDTLGNALLFGYRDLSLFDGLLHDRLWPNGAAFDPPLWSLSVELQGSALVLALAMARRWGKWLWAAAVAVSLLLLLRSPFLSFVVGHLAAMGQDRGWRRSAAWAAGIGGVALCLDAGANAEPVAAWLAQEPLPILPALSPVLLQRGFGAMLIFLALHRASGGVLESRSVLWLGRMSFPVYLVHWPILLAPGAAVTCALADVVTAGWAAAGGMGVAVVLTFLAAVPLAWLDRAALVAARGLPGRHARITALFSTVWFGGRVRRRSA